MRISKYISYEESIRSETAKKYGLDNTPNLQQLEAMKLLGAEFDKIRGYFGEPILVTSFFRSAEVNARIGGSKTSQHTKGEAIDIKFAETSKRTNKELYQFILENINFDQLIWEYGDDQNPAWLHFSFKKEGNRKQVLRIK